MPPSSSSPSSPQPTQHQYEFGGPLGTFSFIMISHLLVYYFWLSLQFYSGQLFMPNVELLPKQLQLAIPTLYSIQLYVGFFIFEFILAYVMPGVISKGLPVPTENNVEHVYLCNGLSSWYLTLILAGIAHQTGIFRLSEIADHFGELLTVAVLFGDLVSIMVYVTAIITNNTTRMSGNLIYDFFMGAVLNPRISIKGLGVVDLKFFAEIRVSWLLLFMLTAGAASKQYDEQGNISGSMVIMLVAHGLYTNACMKGEECIPTTWDIFYEKFGWMLCFWNLAGVPFVYAFNSFYILKNNPQLSNFTVSVILTILVTAYYVWDTSLSQKNKYRMQERGNIISRKGFPYFTSGTLKDPKVLKTKCGTLLVDGWWGVAQKIPYTADIIMSFCWAMSCGLTGILPYFYPVFFTAMIIHRANRDWIRCEEKYGQDWKEYNKIVPWRFIPYVY
jgi:delta24(24(1))-sterol reductase